MPPAPLIGRAHEWALLGQALDSLHESGKGQLVLVAGEPGIGKTRFAEAAAEAAVARGLTVVWGRAWEVEGAPPFWPFVEVLRALARRFPDAPQRRELATLIDDTPGPTDDTARSRLYDAVIDYLRALAARAPLVLVLDDLHAADRPSLMLLSLLSRSLHDVRVLAIGAHRLAGPNLDRALFGRLAREALTITLPRLPPDALAELLRAQGPPADAVDEIVRRSEGNPLYALELARASARGRALPFSVEETLRQHLAWLTPAARTVADAAAVLGRDFDREELLGLAADAGTCWNELCAAGIVEESGGGRATFTHVLLRDAVYDELPPATRAGLHARHAERLAALPARAFAARSSEAVRHALAAAQRSRALSWALVAVEHAVRRCAFEEAIRVADAVLAASAGDRGGDDDRGRLAIARANAHMLAGDGEAGRASALEAAELVSEAGSPELYAEAALVYAAAPSRGGVNPKMLELLETALERLPLADSPPRARLTARLSSAIFPPEGDRSQALAEAALAASERIGDPLTRLDVLRAVQGSALRIRQPPEKNRVLDEEVLRLAVRLGDRTKARHARLRLYSNALQAADLGAADAQLAEFLRDVEELPYGVHHRLAPAVRAGRAALAGDLDAAIEHLREHAARNADDRSPETLVAGSPFRVLKLRREQPPAGVAVQTGHPSTRHFDAVTRSWFAAAAGDADAARQALAATELSSNGPPGIVLRVEIAHLIADRALALRLRPLLASIAAPVTIFEPFHVEGSVAAARARVAALLGEPEAVPLYEESLTVYDRLRAPIHRAWTELELARLVARRDPARARALLGSAGATAERLGLRVLAADVARALGELAAATAQVALERSGEIWTLRRAGDAVQLRDSKGVRYLAELLRQPGREVHVCQLVALDADEPIDVGSAGEVLDAPAQRAYRERIEVLRDRLAEAEQRGAVDAAERVRAELEALARELKRGVGLGGRARAAASQVEKARVNVQRRLKDVLERVHESAPRLADELKKSIVTGTYCRYRG
jgi:hypothetical protein